MASNTEKKIEAFQELIAKAVKVRKTKKKKSVAKQIEAIDKMMGRLKEKRGKLVVKLNNQKNAAKKIEKKLT